MKLLLRICSLLMFCSIAFAMDEAPKTEDHKAQKSSKDDEKKSCFTCFKCQGEVDPVEKASKVDGRCCYCSCLNGRSFEEKVILTSGLCADAGMFADMMAFLAVNQAQLPPSIGQILGAGMCFVPTAIIGLGCCVAFTPCTQELLKDFFADSPEDEDGESMFEASHSIFEDDHESSGTEMTTRNTINSQKP